MVKTRFIITQHQRKIQLQSVNYYTPLHNNSLLSLRWLNDQLFSFLITLPVTHALMQHVYYLRQCKERKRRWKQMRFPFWYWLTDKKRIVMMMSFKNRDMREHVTLTEATTIYTRDTHSFIDNIHTSLVHHVNESSLTHITYALILSIINVRHTHTTIRIYQDVSQQFIPLSLFSLSLSHVLLMDTSLSASFTSHLWRKKCSSTPMDGHQHN